MPATCFECGDLGHVAGECPNREELGRQQHAAHLVRIAALVADWQAGRITLAEKRRKISDENKAFYGPACPRKLTWP